MKKLILFFMVVFYSVNTSMSYAQYDIVPVMDRFVVRVKGSPMKDNRYDLANIYLLIKNMQTGVTYRANGQNYTKLYDGGYEYTLATKKTFTNIRENDKFEITVAFNTLDKKIQYFTAYAGVEQPMIFNYNTKFSCIMTGSTLSGVTRSPIPFVTLYF